MKNYIVIGGIIWLIYKWLNSVERYMKKNGIKYGDTVTTANINPWGVSKTRSGRLVKMNGIPYVKFTDFVSGINMEPFTKDFYKEK